MTIYGYARISVDENKQTCQSCRHKFVHRQSSRATCPKCQHEQPTKMPESIETQKSQIESAIICKWPDKKDRSAVIFAWEITSGMSDFPNREQGGKIVRAVKKGDHIICAALDRGWRNTRDFLNCLHTWGEMGVTVTVVRESIDTSTDIGRLFAGFCALMAEFEWRQNSARRKEMHKRLKAEKRYVGGVVAFGFKIDVDNLTGKKHRVPHVGERTFMRWIYTARVQRHLTWNEIVRLANGPTGMPARDGRPWTRSTLQRVVQQVKLFHRLGEIELPGEDSNKPVRKTGANRNGSRVLTGFEQTQSDPAAVSD